ncbi:MAG: class I SAM-dependent methyltransferase [Pyrinomonadaceae bacterium]
MALLGGTVGYRFLRWVSPNGEHRNCDGSAYHNCSKIEKLLTQNIWNVLRNKVVIDFGCGRGGNTIEIAQHGAAKVIGVDLRESELIKARIAAQKNDLEDRCLFVTKTGEQADFVITVDAFEHFDDPAGVLKMMRGLLKKDGKVFAVFGPTWYHPYGGHLFSVFPWAHLVFTEKALLRWRSDFKTDGATHFREVEGGLNQMTIRRFEQIVADSDFRMEELELVPIRGRKWLRNRFTREFTTAVVRTILAPRNVMCMFVFIGTGSRRLVNILFS